MAIKTAVTMTCALLILSGCATTRDSKPVARADTIRFSAGPCFGICPVYSVTVEPDGSGVLVPQRNTSVPGETRFSVTPAQVRRLHAAFAPFRPATGKDFRISRGENCERAATDMPGYQIVWTREGQDKTVLDFYSGCFDARYGKLRAAVNALPDILDIRPMLQPKGAPSKGH